jgi:hypothetical protein
MALHFPVLIQVEPNKSNADIFNFLYAFCVQRQNLKEGVSYHQQIGLEFKKETSEVLHLEHNYVWC